MSLREKKKAITRDAILDSAQELFSAHGYEDTTMEMIAERAMVAVGTVYNYFSSKPNLLLAMNERETREVLQQGEELVAEPPDNPETGCQQLLRLYLLRMIEENDRDLLREVWSAAVGEMSSLGRELVRLDNMLIEQLGELLRLYQQRGHLDPSLPIRTSAGLLYGASIALVMAYLADGEMEAGTVGTSIDDVVAVSFRDWRT